MHSTPAHVITPGMTENLGKMSGMMDDVRHMARHGRASPEDQQKMLQTIQRLGEILQEMTSPKGPKMVAQHQQELEGMRQRLEDMKKSLEK